MRGVRKPKRDNPKIFCKSEKIFRMTIFWTNRFWKVCQIDKTNSNPWLSTHLPSFKTLDLADLYLFNLRLTFPVQIPNPSHVRFKFPIPQARKTVKYPWVALVPTLVLLKDASTTSKPHKRGFMSRVHRKGMCTRLTAWYVRNYPQQTLRNRSWLILF